jgi:N6-adenosine-specific RNA methylase IME4
MTWPFGDLPMFAFGGLLVDPPWLFETYSDKGHKKAPQGQYTCLPLEEIKAFPVGHLAEKQCIIGLWATSPMLDQQIPLLNHWGFDYCGFIAWGKMTGKGKINVGTGHRLRSSAELLLIGTTGKPPKNKDMVRNLMLEVMRGHSRKPDAQYDVMEKLAPRKRYAEIFARQSGRAGWDHWGNEVDKFRMAA